MKNGTRKIETASPDQTRKLGKRLGVNIDSGTVIALRGDLGSGKTVFVQGLAKGLDVPDTYYITSPTYTLINEYPGRFSLFHIDLYRIEGKNVFFEEIGIDELLYGNGVTVIEWAEKIMPDLPNSYIDIQIDFVDDLSRTFNLKGYGQTEIDLVEKLIH